MKSAAFIFGLGMMLIFASQETYGSENPEITAQLEKATEMHRRADFAHSIPILEKIVEASPRNYEANLFLGEDLLRSGRPMEALRPLMTAADTHPQDVTAQEYIVAAAELLGDFALRSEALESIVFGSGGDEKHLLAWGNLCLNRFHALQLALLVDRQGEGEELRIEAWGTSEGTETRRSLLEQAAAANPEQRGIWGELGVAQAGRGLFSEARESLKEAKRRGPLDPETLRLEALLAASENDWTAAQERLIVLGSRSPTELHSALGQWPASLAPGPSVVGNIWTCVRNRSAECSLTSTSLGTGLGLSPKDLFAEGRWEQLDALPVDNITTASEWLWRGVAEARTYDCAHAIPALERGLNADSRTGSFYLQVCYADQESRAEDRLSRLGNLGAFHELKGDRALDVQNDPKLATREYRNALELRPKDSRLRSRLAEAYLLLGELEPARSAALAALALDARQASALRIMTQIAMNERNYVDALLRLKTLTALQPGDAWAQVNLGITYEQLNQPAETVRYLAPPLAAGYPDTTGALHAQLARAFRELGREGEAKEAAAEASRLANESIDNPGRKKADAH